jgi:hypothetical protein
MTLDGRRVTYYQSFDYLLFPKLPLPALRDPSILSAEDDSSVLFQSSIHHITFTQAFSGVLPFTTTNGTGINQIRSKKRISCISLLGVSSANCTFSYRSGRQGRLSYNRMTAPMGKFREVKGSLYVCSFVVTYQIIISCRMKRLSYFIPNRTGLAMRSFSYPFVLSCIVIHICMHPSRARFPSTNAIMQLCHFITHINPTAFHCFCGTIIWSKSH